MKELIVYRIREAVKMRPAWKDVATFAFLKMISEDPVNFTDEQVGICSRWEEESVLEEKMPDAAIVYLYEAILVTGTVFEMGLNQ